jgi:hypothetical protein
MADRKVEALNEREQACLTHLRQARELDISFSQYCRERDLKFHQWMWVKRGLIRKGVIDGARRTKKSKTAGFAPVRIAAATRAMPTAAAATGCRIRHPSGWTIECVDYPAARWLSALLSGEGR